MFANVQRNYYIPFENTCPAVLLNNPEKSWERYEPFQPLFGSCMDTETTTV